jgi:hypothetical protein
MTRDDIIRMAQEAGFRFPANYDVREPIRRLEHFAALVCEAAREECIDIVAMYGGSVEIEAAIRARGER